MKKYICFIIAVTPLIILLEFNSIIIEQSQTVNELQNLNEQLERECADIAAKIKDKTDSNKKLDEELAGDNAYCKQLEGCIEELKNESANEYQAFHGEWYINSFYMPNTSVSQRYDKYGHWICFRKIHIYLTDDHITDEPIYAINICDKDKLLTELSEMGINDAELTGMIESDYYVEVSFEETYNWNRYVFAHEGDFIYNAKYYPINMDTMLCFSRNDGGKVYVLDRFLTGRD